MGGSSSYPSRHDYHNRPVGHQQTLSGGLFEINGKSYVMEKRLGKGGFGSVYRAKASNGMPVAVKITNLDTPGRVPMKHRVDAFLNEVGLLNRLRQESRHVVIIHDFGFNPRLGQASIVMELGNENLSILIKRLRLMTHTRGPSIDPEMIQAFWRQMVSIVDTLHKNQIVHMDLKPDNLILFGETLKIGDLGISRKADVLGDAGLGTMGFSAPEVMEDVPGARRYYGPKADIWSLGAILYYMVYGQVPEYNRPHSAHPPPGQRSYPDRDLVSMLHRTLVYDPRGRADIHEVARHPYTRK